MLASDARAPRRPARGRDGLQPDHPADGRRRDGGGQGEDAAAPRHWRWSRRSTRRAGLSRRLPARCAGCSSSPTWPTERRDAQPNRSACPSARRQRLPELREVELDGVRRSRPKRRLGLREPLREQLRPDALAAHARRERRVVVLAAAHLADARHDARGAIGKVLVEPALEDRVHLPRQAQDDAERRASRRRRRPPRGCARSPAR